MKKTAAAGKHEFFRSLMWQNAAVDQQRGRKRGICQLYCEIYHNNMLIQNDGIDICL